MDCQATKMVKGFSGGEEHHDIGPNMGETSAHIWKQYKNPLPPEPKPEPATSFSVSMMLWVALIAVTIGSALLMLRHKENITFKQSPISKKLTAGTSAIPKQSSVASAPTNSFARPLPDSANLQNTSKSRDPFLGSGPSHTNSNLESVPHVEDKLQALLHRGVGEKGGAFYLDAVSFAQDKPTLKPESLLQLERVGRILAGLKSGRITISVFTGIGATSSLDSNLSLQRGAVIRNKLLETGVSQILLSPQPERTAALSASAAAIGVTIRDGDVWIVVRAK
jgi:outer membrane protein OmpA-like peptidoglycan-associated protein